MSIKSHLSKHRTTYLACTATAVVVGGVTYYFGGRVTKTVVENAELVANITNKPSIVGDHNVINILNMIERSTPSKIIGLLSDDGETFKQVFASQNEAARVTGHSASMIARCVSGTITDVKGDKFALIDVA
jgi:hypothetical protein